ncbi:hypothetical protein K2173_009276 [Erythroxylum novogranatense]|uniref:ADP-ribosyl cyclase/cyclic ADP-ribose hydrolase n=1 Tax=Erythroxylum novogranatense TaxID=1862640 RepID=A0AAV8T0F2_9ROSI|nr:hypothetical protein K2173_009276 [Erythroxylum novogranatense]
MATHQWKHHVFISFSGKDARRNFVCHLDDALRRKGLKTFVDDQLRRGEEINIALLQAIQDSKVALVIFSENYASSRWCLDELVKIIECDKTHDQIVIPVFYRVTPSDVRNQIGSFGKSFAEHSQNPSYSNKIQEWKDALTKAANKSGWDSDVIREDNKLIDQIVIDVLEKLKLLYPCRLEGFVGLKSKISEVKTLLATGSSDVRMLGISGMGGIGKTTLAEAIFAEVLSQFEGRCFVRNVKASEEGGIEKLLEKLISDLLGESGVKIDTPIVGPGLYFLERLKSKRVFVVFDDVFDDVSDRSQVAYLTGKQCCFGAGSNIIITSRDKKVLKGITDNVYEVKALSYTESHQLFLSNAFTEGQPSQDHILLIRSFVNYAEGNPLAIKVLGSYVCGEGVELWKDTLDKLSKGPNQKIQNVLKVSYEGLDREEQAIFLHIACFFKGENVNEAKRVFRSCGLSANIGVSRLVGKSLVTISEYDELDMHNLLQEMGREIVRQESNDPRRRRRLWDAEEILGVFEGTEATESESIILNVSQIRDIVLDPNVFKRMPNLKFLRFYTSFSQPSKLHLTKGLCFLPSGLRYLYWDGYSLESLPTDFDAKELLVLYLPNSNIKQILKDGGKLKMVARSLFESPLISRVTDIVFGKLPFGIGNIKVPSSSCQSFSKLTSLDMSYCKNLKSFPNNVDFLCLEILNLVGCSNLKKFPEISTNLRKLYLKGTAIKKVHSSSIEVLSRLQELNMMLCVKLESLPSNICKLQALQKLVLSSCSSLKKFPEILEPMYNLGKVDLGKSGIEAIPSSIDNMKGLKSLDLGYCRNLACFPESFGDVVRRIGTFEFCIACKHSLFAFEDLERLFWRIDLSFQSGRNYFVARVQIGRRDYMEVDMTSPVSHCVSYLIDLPSRLCLRFFSPYIILDLRMCYIRELPKDLGSLYYLRELDLTSNDFVEIPASIKQLSQLESLRLDFCGKLQSLPQLPPNLCKLTASNCKSLKTLLAFKQPIFNGCEMRFSDCLKLENKECEAMAYKLLRNGPKAVRLYYPGSRIPEWFRHETTRDIIRIKLPSNWFFNRKFFGFAFCVVLNSHQPFLDIGSVKFECYFEGNYNPTIVFPYQNRSGPSMLTPDNDNLPKQPHVQVWCVREFNDWIFERRQLFRLHCINMASFKFFIPKNGKIKKCGVTPLYMQVDEGCSGIAPLYMQVHEGYDDDEDDADENAYWMLESLLQREMSTKMKMKLKKKDKDYDEDMNSEDIDDDMITEDVEDRCSDFLKVFETERRFQNYFGA